MTDAARQMAAGALGGARTALARIDPARHPEDVAADLVEVWSGIETALRGMLNGSQLTGQALVREVRRRELLTLAQTHALLDFLTLRERLNDTAYQPTATDVAVARTAFTELDAGLQSPAIAAATPASIAPPVPAAVPPQPAESGVARRRALFERLPTWAWVLIAVIGLGVAASALYFARGRDELSTARGLLHDGRREAARAEFESVARRNPRNGTVHLFLARMAREDGDLPLARTHAAEAVRAEPRNGIAHRELGTILFSLGEYELARSFLVRAVEYRPNDNTAQGMLGCALIRLGRQEQGLRFVARAGPGPWSACARSGLRAGANAPLLAN